MNHDDEELTFEEADRRYADLKLKHKSGALSAEDFAAQLRNLMVQGEDGHWWSKSPTTGNWHYHDGEKWVKSTPPHYEPSSPPPEQVTSSDVSQPEWTDPPSSGDSARDDSSTSPQTDRTDEKPSSVQVPSTDGTLRAQPQPTEQKPSQSQPSEERLSRGSHWRSVTIWGLGALALVIFLGIIVALSGAGVSPPPNRGDIFQDDFESVSKDWDTAKTDKYTVGYANGVLKLRTVPGRTVGELKGEDHGDPLEVDDVIVEADATQVSDSTNGAAGWGLSCRAKDYDNYYLGEIYSDGRNGIFKQVNGEWETLESVNASDAFDGSTATNHLRFDCVGNTLTLYLNGQQVNQVEDSTYTSGTVGVFVEATEDNTADTEVTFDNLFVSKP